MQSNPSTTLTMTWGVSSDWLDWVRICVCVFVCADLSILYVLTKQMCSDFNDFWISAIFKWWCCSFKSGWHFNFIVLFVQKYLHYSIVFDIHPPQILPRNTCLYINISLPGILQDNSGNQTLWALKEKHGTCIINLYKAKNWKPRVPTVKDLRKDMCSINHKLWISKDATLFTKEEGHAVL
jgi:hypothetical protein